MSLKGLAKRQVSQRPRLHGTALVMDDLLRGGRPAPGTLNVLCYHDIPPGQAARFAEHVRVLADEGALLSWPQLLDFLDGSPAGEPRFALTFDDGYPSWIDVVLPILEQLQAPATFFVATDLVDSGRTGLTWGACRELTAAGMTVGSHTVNHRALAALEADEARQELRVSKLRLEDELQVSVRDFCAPFGQPGQTFRAERDPALAAESGYRSFATTVRGAMRRGDSPMSIRRSTVRADWPARAVLSRVSR